MGAQYELCLNERETQDYIQETDTFDTWFSSSQWPFATLRSSKPGDFERFYPTSVIESGYDILPFWVMRMLMVGQFATGKLPFGRIYLHGLVRDGKGQKMSKSKGNVINPLEVVEKYGADALRFALVVRSSAGQDKAISESDFKAARNLTNKLWNSARFIITGEMKQGKGEFDKEFREKLGAMVKEVTRLLEDYKVGTAVDLLYDYFWHFYCDEAIEKAKIGALSPTLARAGLVTFVKMWQPVLPFVTEQIWQELGKIGVVKTKGEFLALTNWPKEDGEEKV
jgi:valyl-tRNA synthetase